MCGWGIKKKIHKKLGQEGRIYMGGVKEKLEKKLLVLLFS